MSDTQEATVAIALRFLLENEEHIDHVKLAVDVVMKTPYLFFELIPEVSPTELMARLVKANPTVFMEFVGARSNIVKNGASIISLLIAGEKVPAIKKIRELYELGLREAKDVSDNLIQELYIRGLVKTGYNADFLSVESQRAYDELVAFIV